MASPGVIDGAARGAQLRMRRGKFVNGVPLPRLHRLMAPPATEGEGGGTAPACADPAPRAGATTPDATGIERTEPGPTFRTAPGKSE
jgi:hypothetical protein